MESGEEMRGVLLGCKAMMNVARLSTQLSGTSQGENTEMDSFFCEILRRIGPYSRNSEDSRALFGVRLTNA